MAKLYCFSLFFLFSVTVVEVCETGENVDRHHFALFDSPIISQPNNRMKGLDLISDSEGQQRNNAITVEINLLSGCCYTFGTGKCFNARSTKLAAKHKSFWDLRRFCKIRGINKWKEVSSELYLNFNITYVSTEKKIEVHSCTGNEGQVVEGQVVESQDVEGQGVQGLGVEVLEPTISTSVNELSQIETEVAEKVGAFFQPNVTENKKDLLNGINNLETHLWTLAQEKAQPLVTSTTVRSDWSSQYSIIPLSNYTIPEVGNVATQLLMLNGSTGGSRKKRSLSSPVLYVFTQYFFDLHTMMPFYPRVSTHSSFWQKSNFTTNHPTAVAPYININVYKQPNISVNTGVTFRVNMTADTTLQSVVEPWLFREYRSWFKVLSFKYICLQMDFAQQIFSPIGCTSISVNAVVTCSCDQTGLFTVEPRVVARVRPQGYDLIFYVGMAIGILLLFVTWLALIKFGGQVKSERVTVQTNLVMALSLLHLVVVLEQSAIQKKTSCEAVTFFTHYLMLVTACFALIEGIAILCNLNNRSLRFVRLNRCRLTTVQLCVGWFSPMLFAGIGMAIGLPAGDYISTQWRGYDRCWIQEQSSILTGAVTAPIAVIFVCCFALCVPIFAFATNDSQEAKIARTTPALSYDAMTVVDVDTDHVLRMLVEYVLLCIVLMVPWILYFIPGINSIDVSLPKMYATVVFMSAQGILVFFVYVIGSRDVRRSFLGKEGNYPTRYFLYWYGPERKNEEELNTIDYHY